MKIAYIDHSFHKKTKSTLFLANILASKDNKIINLWSDLWIGNDNINIQEINNQNFDILVFFQILPKIEDLEMLKCKNIILVPMYDNFKFSKTYWLLISLFNIKVISFSKKISDYLDKYNIKRIDVQYYPLQTNHSNKKKNNNKIRILFWYRGDIRLIDVLSILKFDGQQIQGITYIENQDPDKPQKEDFHSLSKHGLYNKITFIKNDYIPKEEYIQRLRDHDIFISPRKNEGIGMSFLEAMSLGIPVIAYNSPTMNEYIQDNKNGFLYDFIKPKTIDFSILEQMKKNLELDMIKGLKKWEKQQSEIISFVKTDYRKKNLTKNIIPTMVFLYRISQKIYRKLKTI